MTKLISRTKQRAMAKSASVRVIKTGAKKAKAPRQAQSEILSSIHESMSGLHKLGLVKKETMREFDELCLQPVASFDARRIAKLRHREKVSQPVLARYMNVSKSAVCQWESGEKSPNGAALKLLNLVERKGLEILA